VGTGRTNRGHEQHLDARLLGRYTPAAMGRARRKERNMSGDLLAEVRTCLPRVEKLREKVRGNADLELALDRIDQVELLFEGMAELAVARDGKGRAAAEAKLATCRRSLQGAVKPKRNISERK
jgi:hypothetical protein